jgi:hypothetical protein
LFNINKLGQKECLLHKKYRWYQKSANSKTKYRSLLKIKFREYKLQVSHDPFLTILIGRNRVGRGKILQWWNKSNKTKELITLIWSVSDPSTNLNRRYD